MTSPEVVHSWGRIRAWLELNAPGVFAKIHPPASAGDIAVAEDAVGVPLPADLRAWWQLTDGMSPRQSSGPVIPSYFDPYPVADALSRRQIWIDVWHNKNDYFTDNPHGRMVQALQEHAGASMPTVDEEIADLMRQPAGTPCEGMYLPVWLPIAGSGMGFDLFVDLRDGPLRGCVMEFDRVGTAQSKPYWPSVAVMLAEIADAFEHGRPVGRDAVRVTVDGGHITWA
ncbi:hypothetical protein ALI144C_44645 [Actinosynnema sp. ALI-1.44]|uniref:SMI1/KNR4 family protein n=1 Tax=Actinosynnema sp. ALI-1.44 TaxID=1933779 RepID=UPI00097C900A|nr:SMI1/KNR4 family protein [Actinosynnema sp. ALI-1.44]ONI73045.1 hypothetical protein ALI144C_44645 [Actinosynnema sp. ALI-1.44]